MNTQEEWRPVIGYEGLYDVSDCGRIRRIAGGMGAVAGLIRAPRLEKRTGYFSIDLWGMPRADVMKRHLVHRLVAAAFLGVAPETRPQVNHKDGDKCHNRWQNLEYVSAIENARHAKSLGLCPRGERNGFSKLRAADVLAIRRLLSNGVKQRTIGAMFGVHQYTIWSINVGRTWAHVQ